MLTLFFYFLVLDFYCLTMHNLYLDELTCKFGHEICFLFFYLCCFISSLFCDEPEGNDDAQSFFSIVTLLCFGFHFFTCFIVTHWMQNCSLIQFHFSIYSLSHQSRFHHFFSFYLEFEVVCFVRRFIVNLAYCTFLHCQLLQCYFMLEKVYE